jgi:hypothetical protein
VSNKAREIEPAKKRVVAHPQNTSLLRQNLIPNATNTVKLKMGRTWKT